MWRRRDDGFFAVLGPVATTIIVAVLIGLGFLIYYAIKEHARLERECKDRGGTYIQDKNDCSTTMSCHSNTIGTQTITNCHPITSCAYMCVMPERER